MVESFPRFTPRQDRFRLTGMGRGHYKRMSFSAGSAPKTRGRPFAMRTLISTSLLVVLAVASAEPALAADSCGGGGRKLPKATRWVSATATPLGNFFVTPNVLTAGLLKGAKKSVLEVEGMLTDGPITALVLPRAFALGVSVNGLPI